MGLTKFYDQLSRVLAYCPSLYCSPRGDDDVLSRALAYCPSLYCSPRGDDDVRRNALRCRADILDTNSARDSNVPFIDRVCLDPAIYGSIRFQF